MAKVSKSQAARMAGVSRPTIDKKIKSGGLSCEKKEDGTVEIDVSELERVFGQLVAPDAVKPARKDLQSDTSQVAAILQSQIDMLRHELDVKRQDQEREREEYRREKDRLHGIIESQQSFIKNQQTLLLAAPKQPEPKKSFLRRWFSS
jgi:hypothetical protein